MATRGSASSAGHAVSVVLVDDEPLVRGALATALRAEGMTVAGEADTAAEAVATVVRTGADVVLIDPRLADVPGVEAIRQLALIVPGSRILVLTRGEETRVLEAIVAGASGYILKSAPTTAIVDAIRATAAGEAVLSSKVAGILLERVRAREIPITTSDMHAADAIRAALTPRELDIFRRLASGESNLEIGRALSLSANTVSNHVASILAKLRVENRIQAAVQAVRSGIA